LPAQLSRQKTWDGVFIEAGTVFIPWAGECRFFEIQENSDVNVQAFTIWDSRSDPAHRTQAAAARV